MWVSEFWVGLNQDDSYAVESVRAVDSACFQEDGSLRRHGNSARSSYYDYSHNDGNKMYMNGKFSFYSWFYWVK